MALLFVDSFDHYAYSLINLKYTQTLAGNQNASTIGAYGRRSTSGYRAAVTAAGGYSDTQQKSITTSGATIIMGFAIKSILGFAGLGTTTTPNTNNSNTLFHFLYLGTSQIWAKLNVDGKIAVYRSSTLLGTSSTGLTQNVYQYIEIKVLLSTTVGTVDIRIDNTSVLALTGQNTRNGSADLWDAFQLPQAGSASVGCDWYIDDLYVADGSGTGVNTFVGDSRVDAQYPDSNGTTRQWTPSTGTDDYAVVDEASANTSDYLTGDVAADICTMGFPAAPVSGATVYGVQVVMYTSKVDAGTATQKAATRIGGVNYFGSSLAVPSSYIFLRQAWDESPATATDWTTAEFDGAEFGMQKDT